MAVVTLRGLTKRYPGANHAAVDDVSLEIADGEFMVLLGPSGCGKSTTLRMIAGLESITGGTLWIDSRPMNSVPAKDRDIAMVFQSYALYPHMSVRENLAFGLRRRGFDKAEIGRRVVAAAQILGLEQLLERKPHALSGGQRQRVALGRAIVRDPKVFLFDEPLSNLDAALRVSMRAELAKLHRRLGVTMIYVTHDQVEAMTMGTRICIMQAGRVAQVGRPLEIYRNPVDTFVAAFLGNPPMNLTMVELVELDGRLGVRLGGAFAEVPHERRAAYGAAIGRQVIFGLRPEDMREVADGGVANGGVRNGAGSDQRAACRVRGVVGAVEPLGAETLVVFTPDGSAGEMIARLPADTKAQAGESIDLALNLARMHLFDPADGRVIPT